MREGSGIVVNTRDRGNCGLVRMVAGLLVALALLVGGGAGAAADEADEDDPHGIDLPFTSRDDNRDGAGTPAAGADGSTFALTAYVCTPGDDADLRGRLLVESSTDPDAFFADGIEREELRTVCTAPEEALTYTLADSRGDVQDRRDLGGSADASYTWTNLSSTGSMYTLGVDMRESNADPIVICTVEGDPPGTLTQYYATDGTIRFYSAEGRNNVCEWFNVDLGDSPVGEASGTGAEDAATPVDAGAEAGSAAIAVRTYTCAPGDDSDLLGRITYQNEHWTTVDPVQGVSLDELRESCAPAEEIAVTVTDQESGEGVEQGIGGEDDGYVTWMLAANGGYAVDADEPGGYGEPLVFCAFHDTGEPAGDLTPSPMTAGVLYVGMGAGTSYTCDWFHVDLGDSNAQGGRLEVNHRG